MEKLKENKYFIAIIIVSTIVLAGIASFTAYRLYQLRGEPVAPNVPSGNVYAFSCEEYEMLIDTDGTIRIGNVSGESQPSQEIEIIIGGQSLGSFTIPALDPQTNAEIGGINLPAGDFNWNIEGDILCSGNQSGTLHESQGCSPFVISLASAQTLPSATPTPSPIPTSSPNPTATPTPTNTPVNPTSTPTLTPTPTTQQVSQVTELPDTGSSLKTFLILFLSFTSVMGATFIFSKNLSQS
jgi:hypothetical protein